jgi:hypothetical protein
MCIVSDAHSEFASTGVCSIASIGVARHWLSSMKTDLSQSSRLHFGCDSNITACMLLDSVIFRML